MTAATFTLRFSRFAPALLAFGFSIACEQKASVVDPVLRSGSAPFAASVADQQPDQDDSDADDDVSLRSLADLTDAEWSEPVNLGPAVNSPSADQNPALSKDQLSLYFGSLRPGGFGVDDIWVSRRASIDSPWEPAVNLGPIVNSAVADGAPSLSHDGHLLFFSSARPGGKGGLDIWVSWRENTHDDFAWEAPVNLGSDVNTPAGESASAYLQRAELGTANFYFTRLRPGLERDIFYAAVNPSGETRGPDVLVEELSVPGVIDAAPSLRRDGLEVFFFSTRPGSLGLDSWTASRASLHDPWSAPVRVGGSVNSALTDGTPNLSYDGRTLIFASNRLGGVGSNDLWITTRVPRDP